MSRLKTNKLEVISDLCKRSLKEKWEVDGKRIFGFCPFCVQCGYANSGGTCEENNCLCPREICADGGTKGYIGELYNKYGDKYLPTYTENLEEDEFNTIINMFKKHIID